MYNSVKKEPTSIIFGKQSWKPVAAILEGPGGSNDPHFPEWGVTWVAVTPQFWRHVDVTFFALYTGYGRRRLSLIKFCFDLGPP